MKEKIIKNILSKKKSISYILLCIAFYLILLSVWTIILISAGKDILDRNLFYKLMATFGIIGILVFSITLYFMKNTNKLSVIKISKEELGKIYDKFIDDKIIESIEKQAEYMGKEIQVLKKRTNNIIALIIVAFISVYSTILFASREIDIGVTISCIICLFTVVALWEKLRVILKSTEKLVEEFKTKRIRDIIMPEVYKRNKLVIKELKEEKVARKNPVLFWFIELILLMWCVAAFDEETIELVKEDIISGIITIVIIFGLPAFFFIKNIYVRYFKQSK